MTHLLKYTGGLITKSWDEELGSDTRMVSGIYTSDSVDLHGHIIDKTAMMAAIEDFKQWGTIRLMHEDPIGKMDSIGVPEWNHIVATVANTRQGDEVLQMVREGIYKAFSVGLLVNSVEVLDFSQVSPEDLRGLPVTMVDYLKELGYVIKITGLTLIEVSIVDRPANPLARMASVSKMIDGEVEALPSITQKDAIGVIQNAFGIENQRLLTLATKEINASNTESIMENENDVVVEEVTPVVETEAVTTETVEKSVDPDVSALLVRFEKALETIELINTNLDKVLEGVEKNAFNVEDTAEAIAKRLSETMFKIEEKDATDETPVTTDASDSVAVTVENTVLAEEIRKAISEEIATALADIRQERKGAVNTPSTNEKEDDATVDLKSLDKGALKGFIVNNIVKSLQGVN